MILKKIKLKPRAILEQKHLDSTLHRRRRKIKSPEMHRVKMDPEKYRRSRIAEKFDNGGFGTICPQVQAWGSKRRRERKRENKREREPEREWWENGGKGKWNVGFVFLFKQFGISLLLLTDAVNDRLNAVFIYNCSIFFFTKLLGFFFYFYFYF